jgi:Na+-transporting NADH:ubiquinone oxidoreductase subunit A
MPKMVVKEGAKVKVGDEIFYSKYSPSVKFVSPASGTISEILRGAKRRILEVRIEADGTETSKDFGIKNPADLSAAEIKSHLLASGCWAFFKQRPYDVIANPEDAPKAIFISAYASAPLAAEIEFTMVNEAEAFQTGINAISKLTEGKTHLSVDKNSMSFFNNIDGVEIHKVSGPHPAGNVGVQIHHIDPINAGDRVWVISPADVAIIGKLFMTGNFDPSRIIAVAGSAVKKPKYYKTKIGAQVSTFIYDAGVDKPESVRFINGDVLTGTEVAPDGYLGFNSTFTAIPEGNTYRMFGWMPFVHNYIPSMSKTSFAWLFKNKRFEANTNLNGEERALVVTGEMEKVLPMDVFPMQLIKECMIGNIEKMENLGIYEVAPEDFALIDYACTSKIEAQQIIREGLDIMIAEVG